MADRPIIFSAPMVRALLDGRKTQTRRILKPQPLASGYHSGNVHLDAVTYDSIDHAITARFSAYAVGCRAIVQHYQRLPYVPGDFLYVRETWGPCDGGACYAADEPQGSVAKPDGGKWMPSIHMPRWASRLTLVVTGVKVERLTDISEDDARAEGVEPQVLRGEAGALRDAFGLTHLPYRSTFANLWESLHGARAWVANPWVIAVSFEVHRANIDALPGGHP